MQPTSRARPLRRLLGARIRSDLVVQHRQGVLQLRDPLHHVHPGRLQQRLALPLRAVALPDQLRVRHHVGDRHPGQPQLADEGQPVQVAVAETALPGVGAVHVGHQPDPLVPAQGVRAHPGERGHLADRVLVPAVGPRMRLVLRHAQRRRNGFLVHHLHDRHGHHAKTLECTPGKCGPLGSRYGQPTVDRSVAGAGGGGRRRPQRRHHGGLLRAARPGLRPRLGDQAAHRVRGARGL
ncbi:hypothetical protein SBRY_20532 [Actinacidiphila bryophytorum]|uniref:Uncharacterized protein n=1 Tax=Actinacidiphila bryophytorum TaxID=1436133 RepID=A0A9W4E4U8_9ACTN|nr:hypothetical protein SBRY_20532 [Actinacidiphila bryophytorum]